MRCVLILALLAMVATNVEAAQPRRYRQNRVATPAPRQQAAVPVREVTSVQPAAPATTPMKGVDDALAEVNAERARRGLRPFVHDPLLNQAARSCAKLRATHFIAGHLASDFAHLPAGASASAAGCGALEPSWGWGTCCTYENYTYAGAAWVMGTDGKRYMHLFVR